MAELQIRGLTKRFGDVRALDGIELDVAAGEFFVILGPSAAGKTTTLAQHRRARASGRGHHRARGIRTSPMRPCRGAACR